MALAIIDEKLIRYVTDTIVEHCHPRRIILFGSHACGDAHPDSDLDLLIEMENRPARSAAEGALLRKGMNGRRS
jgi:uncharacterized protein